MNENFWTWFEQLDLRARKISLRKVFEHLDSVAGPVTIVETGCARQLDNWPGDGQSTVLFDRYVNERNDQSRVYSVDIDPKAVEICSQMVSNSVEVTCQDSVTWLWSLADRLTQPVSLLYLDSYDVDFNYTWPGAAHHLKELTAAHNLISAQTLVVVDDAPGSALVIPQHDDYQVWLMTPVGGKGRLVAEYADAIGAKQEFCYYQVGWTAMAKSR